MFLKKSSMNYLNKKQSFLIGGVGFLILLLNLFFLVVAVCVGWKLLMWALA